MILSLDHQQRLNLIMLIGAQRASVGEMRTFWGLIDRLELNAEEKEAIDYRLITVENGQELPAWNRARGLPARDFEISEAEAQRLRKMIDEWPHFVTAIDRVWLTPLLPQLPSLETAQPASARPM